VRPSVVIASDQPNRDSGLPLAPPHRELYAATMWRGQRSVILAAWFAWGCGARSETQEAHPGYSTAREFCEAYKWANWEWEDHCYGDDRGYYLRPYDNALSDCDAVDVLIAMGLVVYHPGLSGECVAQMRQRQCARNPLPPVACGGALEGQVRERASCLDLDWRWPVETCEPGTYCTDRTGPCGTCQAYARLGEPCVDPVRRWISCEEGSYCDSDTDVCVPDRESGERCSPWGADYCARGLTCIYDRAGGPGACGPPRTGAPCGTTSDCPPGDECQGPREQQTCRKPKYPGEVCVPGQFQCTVFATCNSEGECIDRESLPSLGEDEPCSVDDPLYPEIAITCGKGFMCHYLEQGDICRPLADYGPSCTDSDMLYCLGLGTYCDSETLRCVSCE
jgi:hypothetical protein